MILFCVYWHKYYSLMSSGVRSPPHDIHDKIIDGKIKQILTSLNHRDQHNNENVLKWWKLFENVETFPTRLSSILFPDPHTPRKTEDRTKVFAGRTECLSLAFTSPLYETDIQAWVEYTRNSVTHYVHTYWYKSERQLKLKPLQMQWGVLLGNSC